MNPFEQHLKRKLQEREHAGNLRRLSVQRAGIDFFSNDYLGLATLGIVQQQLQQYPQELLGTGATGSRLLSGNREQTEILENKIAAFHHVEAALLFNSGYDANIGLLTSISNRHTTFLYDELCHASIIDGIKLSQFPKQYKFRHNDLVDLEEKLQRVQDSEQVFVVVESIYSMDGDLAPLGDIVNVIKKYNAALIVDEAHATGVFGSKGEGLVCNLGLQEDVFARVHTFGKALGCHGAAVVGSKLLQQYLINFARSFIYTTALPPHAIAAITCAYEYLSGDSFSNRPLLDLINYFRMQTEEMDGEQWKDSVSPIQALIVGDNQKTKQLAARLQDAGLQINAILHPTVPLGMERLRICLHSFNTRSEIDHLMNVLKSNG